MWGGARDMWGGHMGAVQYIKYTDYPLISSQGQIQWECNVGFCSNKQFQN